MSSPAAPPSPGEILHNSFRNSPVYLVNRAVVESDRRLSEEPRSG